MVCPSEQLPLRRANDGASRANPAAFWLLGLVNNSAYVIMLAGANDISSGSVGVVYLCAILPALCLKLSAPHWCARFPSGNGTSTSQVEGVYISPDRLRAQPMTTTAARCRFHRVSYELRFWAVAVLMSAAYVTVALSNSRCTPPPRIAQSDAA